MAYESKPMGRRLGIYAEKIEKKRVQMGLDSGGFRVKRDGEPGDMKENTEDDADEIEDLSSHRSSRIDA